MIPKILLVIGLRWPEPTATAAGVRMLQLLDVFKEEGYQITFGSVSSENAFSANLEAMGIKKMVLQLNRASFDTFIANLQPNVVLFDRFLTEEQFGWRVAEFAPKALRVLDTEDLHSLRNVREALFKKNMEFTTDDWLQDDRTKREIASIYRCDLSLIISSYEMKLLTDVVRIDKNLLLHLPFMVTDIPELKNLPKFEERTDFIFIGGGKHAPNIDAITWLKTRIWPQIHVLLPNANLHIYGAYLPQHVQEMHKPIDGFYIKGRAESIAQIMQTAKICLAPLRFGAGSKGKLLHAMQFGTPSITTIIGAEGMQGHLEWNGAVTDNVPDFVQNAIALYTDKTQWENAQQNGISLLHTNFNGHTLKAQLISKINSLKTNLNVHRNQNFIGSLLQHQTLQATKYFGKWIEGKNNKD